MLEYVNGFESYNGDLTSERSKWTSSSDLDSISATPASGSPRSGSYSGQINYNFDDMYRAVPAKSGYVVGEAIIATSFGGGEAPLLRFQEGTTVHMALYVTNTGFLRVKFGGTTLATDTVKQLVTSTWYYIEFKAVIHDSAGSYEVRVDGVTIAALTASGLDTRNGGTGLVDRIKFAGTGVGGFWVDDIYIVSTTGGTHTDFLCTPSRTFRVKGQRASSGNGTNTDFTPSTGTDHGALVDESAPNGDTDYNSSSTVGNIDTYNYAALSLPGGATIQGVQVESYQRKTDAGTRGVKTAIRSGGNNYTPNAEISPSTSYRNDLDVFEQDPATSAAWTESGVDAAEFGMKVTT